MLARPLSPEEVNWKEVMSTEIQESIQAMQQGLARHTRACEREPLSHVPLTPMRALSPFDLVNILSTSCSQAGTPLSELGAQDSMEEEE